MTAPGRSETSSDRGTERCQCELVRGKYRAHCTEGLAAVWLGAVWLRAVWLRRRSFRSGAVSRRGKRVRQGSGTFGLVTGKA